MVPFERRASEVDGGHGCVNRPKPSDQHQLRPQGIHIV